MRSWIFFGAGAALGVVGTIGVVVGLYGPITGDGARQAALPTPAAPLANPMRENRGATRADSPGDSLAIERPIAEAVDAPPTRRADAPPEAAPDPAAGDENRLVLFAGEWVPAYEAMQPAPVESEVLRSELVPYGTRANVEGVGVVQSGYQSTLLCWYSVDGEERHRRHAFLPAGGDPPDCPKTYEGALDY